MAAFHAFVSFVTVLHGPCLGRWSWGGGQCTKTPVAGGAGLCQSHARQSRAGVGSRHVRVDGPVPGPKLAEFEQVAAARRVKSSRPGENPLQRGAMRNIASGQVVSLCASREAVKSSEASVAAAQAAGRSRSWRPRVCQAPLKRCYRSRSESTGSVAGIPSFQRRMRTCSRSDVRIDFCPNADLREFRV